jgi:hypothetical protein
MPSMKKTVEPTVGVYFKTFTLSGLIEICHYRLQKDDA